MDSNSCVKIVFALNELFDNAKVDRGHGVDHSLKVLGHADNALGLSKKPENITDRHAIRCAALLHDADDRKFFPESKDYQNARFILRQVFPKEKSMEELTIKMIKLISCSGNGNSTEGIKESEQWMLIPRICDRIEAIGEIGVLRTWTYSKHINLPLFLPTTPRVTSEEELEKIVTSERLAKYLRVKKSDSMIDHFYDKLLHIGTSDALLFVDNPYLRSEVQKRHKFTVEFVLQFGRDGNIDVRDLNRIRAIEWK